MSVERLPWTGQTNVYVCRDVPLDNTYLHTIYFKSSGEQNTYFLGKAVKSYITQVSYQRVNSTVRHPSAFGVSLNPRIAFSCRVPCVADEIYDCNYLCFQNNAPSGKHKWFYCFIREINYINPNNTEIIYEIDYFQTYLFDIDIKESMVEREHSNTDEYFENTMPEPINPNYYETKTQLQQSSRNVYRVYLTYFEGIEDVYPSGVIPTKPRMLPNNTEFFPYYSFDAETESQLSEFFEKIEKADKTTAIVGILRWSGFVQNQTFTFSDMSTKQLIVNGHLIRNKKLLTSQFRYFELNSSTGSKIKLQPELCTTDRISFTSILGNGLTPKCLIVPSYVNNGETLCMTYTDGEVIPYSTSVLSDYFSGNKIGEAIGMVRDFGAIVAGVGTVMASAETGNPVGVMYGMSTASNAVTDISSKVSNYLDKKYAPDNNRGITESSVFNLINKKGIYCVDYFPNNEFLEYADNFFDMFGYSTLKLKKPNLTGRPHWNYVKLINPNIYGSIPVYAMQTIKEIFNSGITLWHNANEVGDYSLDNSV